MGKIPTSSLPEYYKDFVQTKPSLVMGLSIISFGLYIINWIYLRNKEFEVITEEAPNSKRGAFLMMILPLFWFFFLQTLKNIFFKDNLRTIYIIEMIGFILIFILILKYIYDFCDTFSQITKSPLIIWFIPFFIGFLGIIGLLFQFFYLFPFIFFLFIVTPAMQAELNKNFHKIDIKKQNNNFYNY